MLLKIFEGSHSISTAFAINFFYLIVCFACSGPLSFGAVDDYFMARILEGVYGESHNVHLTFVNVLYGYALWPLYHFFPKVGWFYIGELLAVFVSLTTISYIAIKKMGVRWGSIFSALLVACVARDFYLTVQFTMCAAVLGVAGMSLFLYGLDQNLKQKRLLSVAILLVIWGFCMRKEAFLMGVPFAAIAMLFFAKNILANKHRFLLCSVVLVLGLWGADSFNTVHYSAPEYKKFTEFQSPRVILGDKKNYDIDAVNDEIEESGLSVEDFALLTQWTFYDKEAFALDSLKQVTAIIGKYTHPLNWFTMPNKAVEWLDRSLSHPCFWLFFLVGLALLLSRGNRGLYVWGAMFVILALISYLVYLQRLVYRVESGLWLYATVCAIPLWKVSRSISFRKFIAILGIILVTYTAIMYNTGSLVRSATNGQLWNATLRQKTAPARFKAAFEYMESLPNNTVFLASMGTYMFFSYYREPPYLSEPVGSWKRIIPLGYWTPYFPDVENSMSEYGIENPMRDAVKENVVVIGTDEFLLDFLQRHYYENATVDTLYNVDGVKFFKYSENQLDAELQNDVTRKLDFVHDS